MDAWPDAKSCCSSMTGNAEVTEYLPVCTIRPELLPLPKSGFLVHNVEINIRVATVRLERLGKQLCPRSAESFVVLRAPAIPQIKHIKSRKLDI